MSEIKRTSLYNLQKEAGAKFVEFAGWEMPISYRGIKEEHMAVRKNAGIFDVSHMGDLWVRGADATKLLSKVLTYNPSKAKNGECIYAHILNQQGKIIDDMIAVKFGENSFLCVPNASMTQRIHQWFLENAQGMEVTIENMTDSYVCIAFQGPKAQEITQSFTEGDLAEIKFFRGKMFTMEEKAEGGWLAKPRSLDEQVELGQQDVLVTRTGYTGEDGFEFICYGDVGEKLWKRLMEKGEQKGVIPIGLGARDTLRLEKGFLLSGTDFKEDRTPLETGWDFVITWDHDFIGRPILEEQQKTPHSKLRGLLLEGKSTPRHGMHVYQGEMHVGEITSGSFSPMLEKGMALAYLSPNVEKGSVVDVDIRGKRAPATVIKPPFVK
ncbi:MAG: glycine cleavage system aminomethyltransferase GcvT [Candidatus Thermoplasmatota archaeon]|nr:glycine cleavage system aminomethyltransferase GcvT [Candidatus Thermoplasmatota archaeon]